jgi:inorganic pyrophosphatase
MNYKKYQKIKAMQSFKQKFSDMIREYRDGYRIQQQEKKTVEIKSMIK